MFLPSKFRVLVAVAHVAFLLACSSPPDRGLAGAAENWNLILISVDTLRADRLGAYGYERHPTSPWLDDLAARGVRFERVSAPRSLTWPSMATVLTGLYPRSHGVTSNGYSFPDQVQTLPKLLKSHGYQTAAFLGNMCDANHQGWDELECVKDPDITRKTRKWLASVDRNRPFFLWTHWFGAHSPYQMGGRLAREFDPGYKGPVVARGTPLTRLMADRIELRPRDLRHLNALYDAAVRGTDNRLQALFQQLREGGQLENTIIVFAADHGEELFQHHGYLTHACSVYENGLRVPLVVVAPGILLPDVIEQGVELSDLAPTLLDLLGVAAPANSDGRSLLPLIEHPDKAKDRPVFSEWPGEHLFTVSDGRWKLIDNPLGFRPTCFEGAPEDFFALDQVELYNLMEDQGETVNVAEKYPEKVEELRQLIQARFAKIEDRTESQDVPEDLKRRLRALGYVQN